MYYLVLLCYFLCSFFDFKFIAAVKNLVTPTCQLLIQYIENISSATFRALDRLIRGVDHVRDTGRSIIWSPAPIVAVRSLIYTTPRCVRDAPGSFVLHASSYVDNVDPRRAMELALLELDL